MKSTQVADEWKELVIGQNHAIDRISPYINRYKAHFNAANRPIGNFFLLGPTGTGKTRTAETLAKVLHADESRILKIDCGEFQLDHEVAKLIGAPPGYLGHKDTLPLLTQARVNAAASEKSDISIILFDEIEKASPAVWKVLLGILDKATLRLGDNQTVSFEKAIIFLSSNIGALEMASARSLIGFQRDTPQSAKHIESIGKTAINKKFPPEFPNRIDEIITYKTLDRETLRAITAMEIRKAEHHIVSRLSLHTFHLVYGDDLIELIAGEGTSDQYGARELKRTLARLLMNPLADAYLDDEIMPGGRVHIKIVDCKVTWTVEPSSYKILGDGSIEFVDSDPVTKEIFAE